MRCAVVLVVAAACSDPVVPPDDAIDAFVQPTALPERLSQTGLYSDVGSKTVAADNVAFTPNHVLWSDAADKLRWIHLPEGAMIETSDPDHWLFPVGTKWFKEFSKDGKRLETRVIWRVADTGDREADTLLGAYVWDESESDATFIKAGAINVRGTQHDVPSADACWKCHIGEPGRALGYSAVQLGTAYTAPNAALGYLHANCGHCHNPNGGAWSSSSMVLRLGITDTSATANEIVQTTVGVPLQQWLGHGFTNRIVAGDPDNSAVLYRMTQRAVNIQMPPLATEVIDSTGVALIRTWVETL